MSIDALWAITDQALLNMERRDADACLLVLGLPVLRNVQRVKPRARQMKKLQAEAKVADDALDGLLQVELSCWG